MATTMARRTQLLLLLSLTLLPLSIAAGKKQSSVARREDIHFIKCQVCEKVAYEIHRQVQKKESQIAPKKVSEYQIIEVAENVCNLKKAEADWILQIDIVEKDDKLELVDQGIEGQCNSECKTIERACQEIMEYSDTDVAEFFFNKKPSLDSLVKFLCHDLSGACAVNPPPVPKDRAPGEPFVAKSSKEAEMERLLKSMEGMPGAPNMKMYSREDLMNNKFGDEDADEDEDEDDDKFQSTLGKVVREKQFDQKDLKKRIVEGFRETGRFVQGHVDSVSRKIKNWWKAKKTTSKLSKGGKTEL